MWNKPDDVKVVNYKYWVAHITFDSVGTGFYFHSILTAGKWQTLPILLAGQNSTRGDEWWAVSMAAIIAVTPMIVLTVFLATDSGSWPLIQVNTNTWLCQWFFIKTVY